MWYIIFMTSIYHRLKAAKQGWAIFYCDDGYFVQRIDDPDNVFQDFGLKQRSDMKKLRSDSQAILLARQAGIRCTKDGKVLGKIKTLCD